MGLVLHNLVCRRGGRLILSDVSFVVPAGGALVLRGPNGVGKTTLLRSLAGLIPIAGGTARLFDTSLGPEAEGVALSGHLDAVKPGLTVAETLAFWARLYGTDMAPALQAFGLAPLRARAAGRLSAGQKRRLGLARLALSGARLWLMDEPTVSLDTDGVAEVTALLERHLAMGGIAVISTHLSLPLAAETLTLRAPGVDTRPDPFLTGFDA